MNRILLVCLFISPFTWAEHNHVEDMSEHSHEGHLHETMVDGKNLDVNPERFDTFMEGLTGVNVAMVSVKGMVCDFCARGIEKTFSKDKSVMKIDVDLDSGKVMIAYPKTKEIDFDDIKKKILANGQNATELQILEA